MAYPSIEETGAQEGDRVRCVEILETGAPIRFRKNGVYPVILELGQLKAIGHAKCPLTEAPLSWVGFGFLWEKADD